MTMTIKQQTIAETVIARHQALTAAQPGHVIGVLCGNFYEFVDTDAHIVASATGRVLQRGYGDTGHDICGVPQWAASDLAEMLAGLGHKLALCTLTGEA